MQSKKNLCLFLACEKVLSSFNHSAPPPSPQGLHLQITLCQGARSKLAIMASLFFLLNADYHNYSRQSNCFVHRGGGYSNLVPASLTPDKLGIVQWPLGIVRNLVIMLISSAHLQPVKPCLWAGDGAQMLQKWSAPVCEQSLPVRLHCH